MSPSFLTVLANTSFPVHNDFRRDRGIFNLFQDLSVPDLDRKYAGVEAATTNGNHVNGATATQVNGDKADADPAAAMPNGTHNTGAGPSVQFKD